MAVFSPMQVYVAPCKVLPDMFCKVKPDSKNQGAARQTNFLICATILANEKKFQIRFLSSRLAASAFVLLLAWLGSSMLCQSNEAPDLQFTEISPISSGLKLRICRPQNFTNRVDIFTCTNLMQDVWTVAYTMSAGSGDTATINDSSSSKSRFYYLYDADKDSDADRLSDGREKLVYKTNILASDSDQDGLLDGDEIDFLFNPLGADSNGNSVPDGAQVYAQLEEIRRQILYYRPLASPTPVEFHNTPGSQNDLTDLKNALNPFDTIFWEITDK